MSEETPAAKPVRVLCLSGGFSSCSVLRLQLNALEKALAPHNITFTYAQGGIETQCPKNAGLFFGPPPNFCWVVGHDDVLSQLTSEQNPDLSPEEAMRKLTAGTTTSRTLPNVRRAVDRVYKIMEDEGPFDGILGYSEGAGVAASVLVDEERREQLTGRKPMLKFGIFFGGWPPMDADDTNPTDRDQWLLADTYDEMIHCKTLHVMGAADHFLYGGIALYNMCDAGEARMYDHGKGHFIPREPDLVDQIVVNVCSMVDELKAEAEQDGE